MKTEFENLIRRLSFLCCLPDFKTAWIIRWTNIETTYIENKHKNKGINSPMNC